MKQKIVRGLRLAMLGTAIASTGFVMAGHVETVPLLVSDGEIGFHTESYSCWQTKVFQLCEPLPSDLPGLQSYNEDQDPIRSHRPRR
jgi:hypothetical protein